MRRIWYGINLAAASCLFGWGCSSPEGMPAGDGGAGGTAGTAGSSGSGGTQSAAGAGSGGGGSGGMPTRGCASGEDCASGICGAENECEQCTVDQECGEGRLCGAGVCSDPCGDDAPEACGALSCCDSRCVDTSYDVAHCGACGTECSSAQFCGTAGCLGATLANVCGVASAYALLSGQPADDEAANLVLEGLLLHCPPGLTTEAVSQSESDLVNPMTGKILEGGGRLLVFAGGPYWQRGAQFLETERATPVYSAAALPAIGFYRAADDGAIITSTIDESTASHDIVVIQMGRDVTTGAPSLILYGFHENGTRAAVYQFVNTILPNLASETGSYYVYEWTDANADQLPDADEFTLAEAG